MPMTAAGVLGVWHLIGGSEVVDAFFDIKYGNIGGVTFAAFEEKKWTNF